jgi:hypothetical protein
VNFFRQTSPICLVACIVGSSAVTGSCRSASPPELPGLDASLDTGDAGNAGNAGWADTIVAYGDANMTVTCTADLPPCGAPAPACAANAVLGASDGQTFALTPGATILVAFRCATILDHGGGAAAADFTVWADVTTGGSGVVEVSPDGESFAAVGTLSESTSSNQSFAIAPARASSEKFVRITNVGGSDLLLDAIEAR